MDKELELYEESKAEKKYKRKSRRIRRIITASVLLLVMALNIAFTVLADKNLWFTDTSDTRYIKDEFTLYTVTPELERLMKSEVIPEINKVNSNRAANGEENIKLKIIFCADPDMVQGDTYLRYANYTARQLEKLFPEHIEVDYINVNKNPSAVQKYKINSASTIYSSSVIVEFGSEFAQIAYKAFFTASSDDEAPWAYNGEKRFASTIMSLTRAEAPIMCITTNHGEEIYLSDGSVNPEYTEFIKVIEGAGYIPMPLNLEKDEIPENCRMILTFNPQSDFLAFGNLSGGGISEIEKLDKFIDKSYNFMYVCNRETPYLENLEEYLEEWGIKVAREENLADELVNIAVRDESMNLDGGVGDNMLAEYETTGKGSTIMQDLISMSYPPKAVFGDSTFIDASDNYVKSYINADELTGIEAAEYYQYFKNGVSRNRFDVFKTFETATAYLDNDVYEVATNQHRFSLMTITHESREIQEDNYNMVDDASYVFAVASTEFFGNDALKSDAYGNTDILLSALRQTSREVVPVNLSFKAYYVYDIDQNVLMTKNVVSWVYMLALIPAAVVFVVGVVVTVRRKHR